MAVVHCVCDSPASWESDGLRHTPHSLCVVCALLLHASGRLGGAPILVVTRKRRAEGAGASQEAGFSFHLRLGRGSDDLAAAPCFFPPPRSVCPHQAARPCTRTDVEVVPEKSRALCAPRTDGTQCVPRTPSVSGRATPHAAPAPQLTTT